MPSNQIDDLTLGCSYAEARSRLTRLIAEGFELHGALQKEYETQFGAGTWDRQDGANALKERLSCWCNNTVKSVLSSIFPTRAEWDQVTTVERPVVLSGSSDSNVEGALQHFARILRELIAIRDSQLSIYAPPSDGKTKSTSINGYVAADTLALEHGIPPQRLSEAARQGKVKTKSAPRGQTNSAGKRIRILYYEQQAIKHCTPKKRKSR